MKRIPIPLNYEVAKNGFETNRRLAAEDPHLAQLSYQDLTAKNRNELGCLCENLLKKSLAHYALERNAQDFAEDTLELSKFWLMRMRFYLDERVRFPPSPKGQKYDYGAVGDFFFAWPLANYVITQPRECIRRICAETSYGRYGASPRLNSIASIYARMLRAYYLEDSDWLCEEISRFPMSKVSQDVNHNAFAAPKKYWEVFRYLFEDRREEFLVAAHQFNGWYERRVKTHMISWGNGYSYTACINMVLLSAIKIAIADKKWEINIDAQFLPMDIVNVT